MDELDRRTIALLELTDPVAAFYDLPRGEQDALFDFWKREVTSVGYWHCPVLDRYLPYRAEPMTGPAEYEG